MSPPRLRPEESQSIAETIMAIQGRAGVGIEKGREEKLSLVKFLQEQDTDIETPEFSSVEAINKLAKQSNLAVRNIDPIKDPSTGEIVGYNADFSKGKAVGDDRGIRLRRQMFNFETRIKNRRKDVDLLAEKYGGIEGIQDIERRLQEKLEDPKRAEAVPKLERVDHAKYVRALREIRDIQEQMDKIGTRLKEHQAEVLPETETLDKPAEVSKKDWDAATDEQKRDYLRSK